MATVLRMRSDCGRELVRHLWVAAARRCPRVRCIVLVLVLGASACSEKPATTPPPARLPFGVQAVPRGAPGADPLFVEAYDDMLRGGFAWSQIEIDWGTTELSFGRYDWKALDDHVRQSLRTGLPLSLVIRIVDEEQIGPLPDDLRGQSFSSPNLRVRFPVYVRDAVVRSRGRLVHLWIGRAVDRRFSAHPEDLQGFAGLLALAADSVHATAPDLPVGTSFTAPVGGEPPAGLGLLRERLDRLGWVVLPLDAGHEPALGPEETVSLLAQTLEREAELPTVVTEVGYRRDASSDRADRFLAALHTYLEDPPGHLQGVTWFGLYDWSQAEAEARSARLHPGDPAGADAHAGWLRASGLAEVSGTPTALWYRARDWNGGR